MYCGDRILVGETFSKYKQFVENTFDTIPRQALHAKTLGFVHPKTSQVIKFDSDLPDDFSKAIERWKNYAKHLE